MGRAFTVAPPEPFEAATEAMVADGSFSLAALHATAALPFCCLARMGVPLVREAVPLLPAWLVMTDDAIFAGAWAPDALEVNVVLAEENDDADE